MSQPMPHATTIDGPRFEMRASASDRLPLGSRLPAPWPAVLFALAAAALLGAYTVSVEESTARQPRPERVRTLERTGTPADWLAQEWVWKREERGFDDMFRSGR